MIQNDLHSSKYYDSSEDEFDDDGESEEDFDVGSDGESDDDAASPVAEMDEISSDEEDNEFGADLYKDDEDRYRLAQMTDMDRQAILYERGEQRNAIRQRNQLKSQLRRARGLPASSKGQSAASGAAKKTRSAKASAAAASDAPRKVSGKKAALDALKERRKADGARSRRNEDDDEDDDYGDAPRSKPAPKAKEVKESVRAQKQRQASEAKAQRQRDRHRLDSDDEDDPAYHEVVYDDHGKRIILTSEIDKDYLAKMMVKRDELVKWMDSPHWAKTVKGSFVRLSLGRNDSGDPIYRIAEIIDFNPDGRSYELPPDSTGTRRSASMTISVAIGGMVKDQTLERVSNGPFSPEEYESWVTSVKASQQLALPTRRTGLRIAKQLADARTYVRTEADLEKDIAKNMEKERVKREQRDFSSPPSHSHSADIKRTDIVSQINKRNRGTNSAVEAAYTPESAAESAMNPFARLPTLTTQIGTARAPTADSGLADTNPATSATQTSSSASASTATYTAPASYGSYSSSANGRGGPATRPIAAPVSGAPPTGRTISLGQYFNRR